MSKSKPKTPFHPSHIHQDDSLGKSFCGWFLDYASYVATDRAIPHLSDGLKPVQRRILHVMHTMEDGRYNKNASIIGETTKYHPHGDASIRDALVQLGQKELCIDTQGNWGNIHTGHGAAAPRYIEARLTEFARETLFNPALTQWQATYDGRKREPLALPSKFPILLVQGAEGIGVGIACRILPHNFGETVDAMVAALQDKPFALMPDFPTGGIADVSQYNDGQSGGRVRVRSHIDIGNPAQGRRLIIRSVPFGVTTEALKDSIQTAHEKGKVNVDRIEDSTAANVEIVVKLGKGVDPEQAREALFAFTKCEQSLAVYACVLDQSQPRFVSISDIVRHGARQAEDICRQELQLELDRLQQQRIAAILEKVFIEQRVYRLIEKCETDEAVRKTVQRNMKRHLKGILDQITEEQVTRLLQIQVRRISRYDAEQNDQQVKGLEEKIQAVQANLANLRNFTIHYLKSLKTRFGKAFPRLTKLEAFEKISLVEAEAALTTETLYFNREMGFAGTALKDAGAIEVGTCSSISDTLTIRQDGIMVVQRVEEKYFIGENPWDFRLHDKDDTLVHVLVYHNPQKGTTHIKRFQVGGIIRGKEYPLTHGKGATILWHGVHREPEAAPQLKLQLDGARLRNRELVVNTGDVLIKGRSAQGNILTKHSIKKVSVVV